MSLAGGAWGHEDPPQITKPNDTNILVGCIIGPLVLTLYYLVIEHNNEHAHNSFCFAAGVILFWIVRTWLHGDS